MPPPAPLLPPLYIAMPDFNIQPVLVIEIPRESLSSKTTCRFFEQPTSELDLKQKISFSRWKYIGRFLVVKSSEQQVTLFLTPFLPTIFFILFPLTPSSSPQIICRYTSHLDWTFHTIKYRQGIYRRFFHPFLILNPRKRERNPWMSFRSRTMLTI